MDELTPEEKIVVELFRKCESVTFNRYEDSEKEAEKFVSILGNPVYRSQDNQRWFTNTIGKIDVVGFIEER